MGIGEATATAVIGTSLGAMGLVIGQISIPDSAPNWLQTGGIVICVTFTVWYGYYTTTKTIPGLVEEFRNEQKETRISHEKNVERMTSAFEKAMSK